MNETDFEKYKGQQTEPYWIQSLKVINNRAICDRCGEIQPNYASLQTIDKWNAYHFSRSCILAALNEADALRADLDQAITHLHWLTVGGEFAAEAFNGEKEWCFASAREFGQAQVFLKDFRSRQPAAIKPKEDK